MKNRLKLITIALLSVICFLIGAGTSAFAYTIWKSGGNSGTNIHFHAWSGFVSDTKTNFDISFDQWNYNASKPYWIDRGSDTSSNAYPVQNGSCNITKNYAGTTSYLMQTYATVTHYANNKVYLDEVDISVNGSYPWINNLDPNADAYIIRNAFTHEVGHVYGLGHSDVKSATMYPSAEKGTIYMCTVAQDDKDGIWDIYH